MQLASAERLVEMEVHMRPRRLTELTHGHGPDSRRRRGFSLIELMVVVTITGVLASVALPTFTGYIQRARTSEAVQFLGVIKLRQEAYRAEFGSYLVCPSNVVQPAQITSESAFLPGSATLMKDATTHAFPTTGAADTPAACFSTLGAKPDGAVRFGYGWAAGPPGGLTGANPALYGIDATNQDHYFIAQAVSDLDGDGTACLFELTSFTRNVWIGLAGGGALPAGWE